MLRITPAAWAATLDHLRRCGADRECVVYWSASLAAPDLVDQVVHPDHTSTPWHYSVKEAWLGTFFVSLYAARRTIRAQVHTHEDEAFHSATDDAWPLVHAPGFLSLVLPRFAREPLIVEDMYLAEITTTGDWASRHPRDRIEGLP